MKERIRVDDQGNTYIEQWADEDYPLEHLNEDDLMDKLRAAVVVNRNFVAAAKPATAAAQANQAYDQAVRLTKEVTALIKIVLKQFDDNTGT